MPLENLPQACSVHALHKASAYRGIEIDYVRDDDGWSGIGGSTAVHHSYDTVQLGEDGVVEPNEAFEEAEDDPSTLREVLDAGDQGSGVGERLGVGPDADVDVHLTDDGARYVAGDGEVDHEVAEEVHGGADRENDPGRCDLVDEAGEDAHVAAEVLKEAEGVEGLLVVVEGGLYVLGVDAEDVGGAGCRQYEQASEDHEEAASDDLGGEGQGLGRQATAAVYSGDNHGRFALAYWLAG
ncbi:uncharacterized protein A4U43_C07F3600 [Asparagus officinalis]|uniref:Uncharacterized protein n=1 Tax=Asparagus officinalis TaxID=4686 RepID=A0A5P1E985_ASPOF|nr:uncharacterized protein A4U43_C07F3600 [Asparagus officinalis]